MEVFPLCERPEFIHSLSLWAYNYWYADRGLNFSLIESDYKRRSDFSQLPVSWVAVENNIPVGMVSLKEHDLSGHKHLSPWLSALYVVPEFRNRGVASQLIDTVIAFTCEQDFPCIHLFTDYRNGEYLSLYYEKRGWEHLEKTSDFDGRPTSVYRYIL